MRRALLLCFALAACGRIGFAPGGGDDVITGDGGPDAPLAVGRWRSVSVGPYTTCAITLTGELSCWGYNEGAQVGSSTTSPFADVTQVPGTTWEAVSVAETHTCALRDGGELWCWGYNGTFALGRPPADGVFAPMRTGSDRWKRVETARGRTCGIQVNDTLWCWGYNGEGQSGLGDTATRMIPTQVGAATWSALAVGDLVTCGIQTDGSLWCWGDNGYGTVGDGTRTNRSSPWPISDALSFTVVDTFGEHACALATDGSAWCWGWNYAGQCGNGQSGDALTPVMVALPNITALATEQRATCVVSNGDVHCFGAAGSGAFGRGADAITPVALGIRATALSGGGETACAINDAAQLSCIGANAYGQAGPPSGAHLAFARADARTDWTKVVAGRKFGCGLAGGETRCWGYNEFGEHGNGTYDTEQTPLPAAIGAPPFVDLASGIGGAVGITASSGMWQWGYDPRSEAILATPVAIAAGTKVAFGDDHLCYLSGTTLICGGDNSNGQLGDGTIIDSTATTVPGTWTEVAAGGDSTCALDTAGDVFCWGANGDGQLGIGAPGPDQVTPQAVVAPANVTRLFVGPKWGCLIAGGQLHCWGNNAFGVLGLPDGNDRVAPTRVGTRSDWTHLTHGDLHACGLAADRSLWCWGHGDFGQIDTPLANLNEPRQIAGEWISVASGEHFTCAVNLAGERWCGGDNLHGELGNGRAWRETFTQVP